ncbi:integrase, catalytic region, zinc finger, CCHC-type containing protein [Tanacetum coccineum]
MARSYNTQEESAESSNVQKETGNVQRALQTSSSGNDKNVQCYNCSAKGHYAQDCPKPRVRGFTSPGYDYAFISEVQTPSISFMNMLFSKSDHEKMYHEQPKIINSINGDDQINRDIIFDNPNIEVNDGIVEHDQNAHDQHDNALELLARNAYKEAEKVKQQNVVLTKQLEGREVLRFSDVSEMSCRSDRKGHRCPRMHKIRALEKERDNLQMSVSNERKHVLELKNAQTSLKHKFNKDEDKYLDDILKLEAKVKKNENVVVKMSNSAQALFMLGRKPLSVYDPQLKHGLGYENPYTLKQANSANPKLYDASFLHSSKVRVNVRDTEEILKDTTKS